MACLGSNLHNTWGDTDGTGHLVLFGAPQGNAQGNWTAQEEYRVDVEFGKPKLGLVGYTTRALTYRR